MSVGGEERRDRRRADNGAERERERERCAHNSSFLPSFLPRRPNRANDTALAATSEIVYNIMYDAILRSRFRASVTYRRDSFTMRI